MSTSIIPGAGQHTAGRPRPTTLICGCGHITSHAHAGSAVYKFNQHDCDHPHRQHWPYAGRTAELIEDLTFMLAHGETWAARRLGIPTDVLEQRLRRARRQDLANIIHLQETWTC